MEGLEAVLAPSWKPKIWHTLRGGFSVFCVAPWGRGTDINTLDPAAGIELLLFPVSRPDAATRGAGGYIFRYASRITAALLCLAILFRIL